MRLRNILVLLALAVFAVGMSSCGKKAEEAAPADSTAMTPAPAAPAAEPAPAAAPATDSAAHGGGEMKK